MAPIKPRVLIKNVHNLLGLASAAFLGILLLTGIALNHPGAWIPGAASERLSLEADPARPGRLYRGTASALERSEDGGRTWEEVPMAFPALEVMDMAFHPRSPDMVYALQRWHGPLLSRDGGTVWEPVALSFDPQAAGIELKGLSVSNGGVLYLETSAGLLRRPAEGAAWEPVDFDTGRRNWSRIVRTLHNGHFFGEGFVKVYDAAALALLVLIISGIVLWRLKTAP